jgi:uncharacterized protein
MAINGFKVMDSDMHVQEPADLWTKYIEPKYRDQAPVGTTNYLGDQDLIHDGRVISRFKVQAPYQGGMTEWFTDHYDRRRMYEDYDRRGWDGKCQLEAMDAEGIDVAVLYPTRGLFAHAKEYDDDDFAAAVSRAYNNWLADLCAADPKRMYGAAMVPAQNVQAAVEEIRRAREELGFVAIFLRPNPVRRRNWHNPCYDPLWEACQKYDMAVGFHEGTPCELPVAMGERFSGVHADLWMTEHVAAHPIEQMYACLSMIQGGVYERFPGLRVAYLEGNCSWVPFWLWRMDEHWEARQHLVKDRVKRPPSEYFKKHCYVGIESDEEPGKYAVDWGAGDNIVFSTDFPHPDSRFPRSVRTLVDLPLAHEQKRKILWDNCARLYNFR